MNLNPWKKRAVVIAAAVTVVAGVVAGRERPTLELIQEKPRAAAVDDGIDLGKLQRPEASLPQSDPFARAFGQPEKSARAPGVADKPTAPPLPFQYLGRITENGKTEVYVLRGEELHAITNGQKIGDYRVDKIAEASISFTYLPLKTKQTLDLQ